MGCELQGQKFMGPDLRGWNLMGPKLKGQKLTKTWLEDTRFMRLQLRTRITQDLLHLRGGIKIGDRNWGEEKYTGPELRGQKLQGTCTGGTKKTLETWNEGKRNSWVSKGGQKFSGPAIERTKAIETYIEGTKFTWSELRGGTNFSPDLNWRDKIAWDLNWGGQKFTGSSMFAGTKITGPEMRGQNYSRNHLHSGDIISRFLSPQFSGPELRWQENRHLKSPHHHAVCSCSRVREGVSLSLSLSLFPAIPCKSFLSRTQFGDRLQLLYAQLQSQNAHQTAQCRKHLIGK
jgi:uncharacterized protein YjbI with pentapeptide repeats